jgi:hypothetical protein
MAVGSENTGQFGTYPRRGTGNQRYPFSHDSMLLNTTRTAPQTRTYALGGMQAARKRFGILTPIQNRISAIGAWPFRRPQAH